MPNEVSAVCTGALRSMHPFLPLLTHACAAARPSSADTEEARRAAPTTTRSTTAWVLGVAPEDTPAMGWRVGAEGVCLWAGWKGVQGRARGQEGKGVRVLVVAPVAG